MSTSNDFRNGMALNIDGKLVTIVEFQHVKPGKGGAFVRSKLKDVRTGAVVEKTWRAGEKVEEVRLERIPMQFLYQDDDMLNVMHPETFDQIAIPASLLGNAIKFLKESAQIEVMMHGEKPITAELPNFLELEAAAAKIGTLAAGELRQCAAPPADIELPRREAQRQQPLQ